MCSSFERCVVEVYFKPTGSPVVGVRRHPAGDLNDQVQTIPKQAILDPNADFVTLFFAIRRAINEKRRMPLRKCLNANRKY